MSENPFDFDQNPNLPTADDIAVRQSIPGYDATRADGFYSSFYLTDHAHILGLGERWQ